MVPALMPGLVPQPKRTPGASRGSIDETLPLVSADGNFAITADARIDNRQELLDLIRPLSCPAIRGSVRSSSV